MSIQKIHLRKLLQLFDAANAKRVSLLRADIRTEINKEGGVNGDGGDFYIPFWADAKNHILGTLDLTVKTEERIEANDGRKRLYPQLKDGFLRWWNEARRWVNEPFRSIPENLSVHHPIAEVGAVVKIENVFGLEAGNGSRRIVYPYFSEEPILTERTARLGLWLLSEGFSEYAAEELRILDVIRSRSFSLSEGPFQGDERKIFVGKYKSLLAEYEKLKKDY